MMASLIQIETPQPTAAKKFKTTRRMRSICTELRNWIKDYTSSYDEDLDAGKMTVADLVNWLNKYAELEPNNPAVNLWKSLGPETQTQVKTVWPHLRGPTWEEHAAAWAQRGRARTIARNPLFAVAGAIEEVAKIQTPEDVLADMAERRMASRKRHKTPSIRQQVRARQLEYPDEATPGRMSINQCLIWRFFLRYGKPEPGQKWNYLPITDDHIEEARLALEAKCDGDKGYMKTILDGIVAYHAGRGAIEDDGIRQGIAGIRILAARIGTRLADVVVPDVITEREIPAMLNSKEAGRLRKMPPAEQGSLFDAAT